MAHARRLMNCEWNIPNLETGGGRCAPIRSRGTRVAVKLARELALLTRRSPRNESSEAGSGLWSCLSPAESCLPQVSQASFGAYIGQPAQRLVSDAARRPLSPAQLGDRLFSACSRTNLNHPVCSPRSRNPLAVARRGSYKRTDHHEKRNVDQCGSIRRDPHRDR